MASAEAEKTESRETAGTADAGIDKETEMKAPGQEAETGGNAAAGTAAAAEQTGTHETAAGENASAEAAALYPYLQPQYLSEWDETGTVQLVSVTYPQIYLRNEEGFTELKEGFDAFNEQEAQAFEEEFDGLFAAAKEDYAFRQEEGLDFNGYVSESEAKIMRADEDIFSFRLNAYSYTGGAHPNSSVAAYNYDTKTGKEVALSEVISNQDKLCEVLIEKLEALSEAQGGNLLSEGYKEVVQDEVYEREIEGIEGIKNKLTWTLSASGMTVYFSPYEVGPYAAGLITVELPFAEHTELFSEKWTAPAREKKAVLPLSAYEEVQFDVDGDGAAETVSYREEDGEYGSTDIVVDIDGNSVSESAEYGVTAAYLMRTEAGKTYLYAESRSDNDYRVLNVFDLSTGVPEAIEETGQSGDSFYGNVPADPADFLLGGRMYVLSTYYASRPYAVGPDGLPDALSEMYGTDRFDGFSLITKREVPAEQEGKACMIPANTEVMIRETDGKAFVLAEDEAGNRYELTVLGAPGYPQTIGGTDIEECFDGIFFAG